MKVIVDVSEGFANAKTKIQIKDSIERAYQNQKLEPIFLINPAIID